MDFAKRTVAKRTRSNACLGPRRTNFMLQESMISAFKKAMAVFVAGTTIVGTTTTSAFAGSFGDGCATPIQHIVIIFQENVSFDHYFATYPNAMNPPGEP